MGQTRRQHSGECKARVAFAAMRGAKTVNALASESGVHPVQISQWKRAVQDDVPRIVSSRRGRREQEEEEVKAAFYQQIGQRKVAVDWLKKKLDFPVDTKRQLIEVDHPAISVRRQWAFLGLPRSSRSDEPRGDSAETLQLMRLLETQSTATPFDGMRRMTAWLRTQGYQVNHTRVARLMRQRGMEALYTKPHLRQATAGHVMSPEVLRRVKGARGNHVWSTAITSIRLHQGCVSLVAVRDWCSRYVLSWALSVTLEGQCCREALTQARRHGSRPEIFHTDQGAQCTRSDFTNLLTHEGIRISMDGRGRALDHVFVERLWRTVTEEEVD